MTKNKTAEIKSITTEPTEAKPVAAPVPAPAMPELNLEGLPQADWTADQLGTYCMGLSRRLTPAAWKIGKALDIHLDHTKAKANDKVMETVKAFARKYMGGCSYDTLHKYIQLSQGCTLAEVQDLGLMEAYGKAGIVKPKKAKPAKGAGKDETQKPAEVDVENKDGKGEDKPAVAKEANGDNKGENKNEGKPARKGNSAPIGKTPPTLDTLVQCLETLDGAYEVAIDLGSKEAFAAALKVLPAALGRFWKLVATHGEKNATVLALPVAALDVEDEADEDEIEGNEAA